MSALYELDETLSTLAAGLSPVANRMLMRKIASYLRTQVRSNITHQRDAKGKKWQKRKNKKIRKKMLLGYRKTITARSAKNNATVGMFGGVSETTRAHHEGNLQDGVKYPDRPLVGWNAENHRVIKIMILQALEDHVKSTGFA